MIYRWCNWLYLIGVVFLASAVIGARIAGMPPWFSQPVYESVIYLFTSFCVMAIVTNILAKYTSSLLLSIFVLSIVLTAILIPNIYINGAVFFGQNNAKFNTWHLLSMFTVMYQVQATILIGFITGIICSLIGLTWKFKNVT